MNEEIDNGDENQEVLMADALINGAHVFDDGMVLPEFEGLELNDFPGLVAHVSKELEIIAAIKAEDLVKVASFELANFSDEDLKWPPEFLEELESEWQLDLGTPLLYGVIRLGLKMNEFIAAVALQKSKVVEFLVESSLDRTRPLAGTAFNLSAILGDVKTTEVLMKHFEDEFIAKFNSIVENAVTHGKVDLVRLFVGWYKGMPVPDVPLQTLDNCIVAASTPLSKLNPTFDKKSGLVILSRVNNTDLNILSDLFDLMVELGYDMYLGQPAIGNYMVKMFEKVELEHQYEVATRLVKNILSLKEDMKWSTDYGMDESGVLFSARFVPKLIPILVDLGYDVTAKSLHKETAFHLLVQFKNSEETGVQCVLKNAVKALEGAGLSLTLKDEMETRGKSKETVQETAFNRAVMAKNDTLIKLFLEVNYKSRSLHQTTAFHYYASFGRITEDVMASFVSNGFHTKTKNAFCRTALHCYLERCPKKYRSVSLKAIELFKKIGNVGDLSITDNHGLTPMMVAIHKKFPVDTILALLPEGDQHIIGVDKLGHNLLTMAIIHYVDEAVNTLVTALVQKGVALQVDLAGPNNLNMFQLMANNRLFGRKSLRIFLQNGVVVNLELCRVFLDRGRIDLVAEVLYTNSTIVNSLPDIFVTLSVKMESNHYKVGLKLISWLLKTCAAVNPNHLELGKNFLYHLTKKPTLPKDVVAIYENPAVDTNVMDRFSFVAQTLYYGRYHLAIALLKNFASVKHVDVKRIKVVQGILPMVQFLYEAGFKVEVSKLSSPDQMRARTKRPRVPAVRARIEQEVVEARSWVEVREKKLDPLWQMAARKLREVAGGQMHDLLKDIDLPEKTVLYVKLENIGQYKQPTMARKRKSDESIVAVNEEDMN